MSLLNLLQHCFCFMFCIFGHQACGLSSPTRDGIHTPVLEGKVLTTGPPGKSLVFLDKLSVSSGGKGFIFMRK